MKIEVKSFNKSTMVGSMDLPESIFCLDPREDLIARMVKYQLAKKRSGTHKVKNRGEISCSGRKMYKQKGTGRARHSTAAAAQFRGGGRAFGPVVRSHAHKLPKKVRRLALKHALSAKLKDNMLVVVDVIDFAKEKENIKTKLLQQKLNDLKLSNALIIDIPTINEGFVKAIRNIPNVDILSVDGINTYSIIKSNLLVLTKSAINLLMERLQ